MPLRMVLDVVNSRMTVCVSGNFQTTKSILSSSVTKSNQFHYGSNNVLPAVCVCVYMSLSTYLVNESPECGKDVSEGSFWLADFKEGQVNVEHLLHQGVVTFAVQQLGLTHARTFLLGHCRDTFFLGGKPKLNNKADFVLKNKKLLLPHM